MALTPAPQNPDAILTAPHRRSSLTSDPGRLSVGSGYSLTSSMLSSGSDEYAYRPYGKLYGAGRKGGSVTPPSPSPYASPRGALEGGRHPAHPLQLRYIH